MRRRLFNATVTLPAATVKTVLELMQGSILHWGTGPATAIHQAVTPDVEYVDGSFIVPPGGVLALMNQISTTTISVNGGLIWEEVPVLD